MNRSIAFLTLPLLFVSAPGRAETAGAAVDAAPQVEAKDDSNDAIVITGKKRRDDVLGDVSVLGGAALAEEVRPTLGETLASQPGVSTSGSVALRASTAAR